MNKQIPLAELASRALRISTPGISLGAIALAPYLLGMGVDAAASFAGLLGWAVPVVVAMSLLVLAINDVREGNGSAYAHGARSYATFVALNVAATGLAYAAFWVIVSGAAGLLAAPAGGALAKAMASGLSPTSILIVAAISVVGAVAITAWADSRADE